MMGVGKSTVGKSLSLRLNVGFRDIDTIIEKKNSLSIKEIFEKKGEEFFRKIEEKETLDCIKEQNLIIALGGGAFMNKNIRENVKKNCISITVSDANKFNSLDSDTITKEVWKEVCTFLGKNIQYENAKIIKEKKATYIQSPKNNALIQKFNEKKINNIFAGDWTQNTLPCTIEASILSGKKAIESL